MKYEWLEEIINQKDAKIKLLDSRIKILQVIKIFTAFWYFLICLIFKKYVTQKSIDS